MKAINTSFDGYKFRSRLEARWAVFFKTIGLPYEYEMEGFDLGNGIYYLPDFWLPSLKTWFEVKGSRENIDKDQELLERFGRSILPGWGSEDWYDGKIPQPKQLEKVVVAYGSVPSPEEIINQNRNISEIFIIFPGWDNNYMFCVCKICEKIGLEFDGRSARINCGCKHEGDKDYTFAHETLIAGYAVARSARFEYGEKPF